MKKAKIITFYSYKDCAGKSEFIVEFLKQLVRLGKKVALLDLNLFAPGLHHLLLADNFISRQEWEKRPYVGLLSYLALSLKQCCQVPDDLQPYFLSLNFEPEHKGSYFMPSGEGPSREYFSCLLNLDWQTLFPLEGGCPGIDILLDLRNRATRQLETDIVLINAPSGISDLVTASLFFMPYLSVIISDDSIENSVGSQCMIQQIERLNQTRVGDGRQDDQLDFIHYITGDGNLADLILRRLSDD
jgi:hypothetical protein